MKMRYLFGLLLVTLLSSTLAIAQSYSTPIFRVLGSAAYENFWEDGKNQKFVVLNDLDPYRPHETSLDVEYRVTVYDELAPGGKRQYQPVLGAYNNTILYLGKTIYHDGSVGYWLDIMFNRTMGINAPSYVYVEDKLLRGFKIDSSNGVMETVITQNNVEQFINDFSYSENGKLVGTYSKILNYVRIPLTEEEFLSIIRHHRFAMALSTYAYDFDGYTRIKKASDWRKLQNTLEKLYSINK